MTSALQRLETYVNHETPSGDGERIRALAQLVADDLRSAGAEVELLDAAAAGANLRAFVSADDPSLQPLLVLGHLDTVWPVGTLAERPFRVVNGRAEGPGIFDMKAGVAVAVEALTALHARGARPRRGVQILFTCDEEVGSRASRAEIERLARGAHAVLVPEPSLPGGAAKTARKGIAQYRMLVRGRAAHSGIEPEKGVSAVGELALQIPRILALADARHGTTLNVGRIGGGSATNVVPAEAWADVEVRYWTAAEGERVAGALRALRPQHPEAAIDLVRGESDRPPLERTDAIVALYELARAAARRSGFDLPEGSAGGASDGSLTAALGVPTLDGLGPDGGGAHAVTEHVLVDDLPRRVALFTELFGTL